MEQETKSAYDEKRKQKEEAVRKAAFKRRARKAAIWSTVIVAIILIGKYLWQANREATRVQRENSAVTEVQGEFFKSQGQDHIKIGDPHPEYSSNPPTSGWHYVDPARSGIYDTELPDERLIHNLEHGHIWISYKPDIGQATIDMLNAIKTRFDGKIVVAPRSKNDSPIVLAAWEYLLKLDQYDEQQILGFIKAHRGKGPEDIPDMGI